MIQPIRKQVLFEPYEGDEISDGGIFVPEIFRKPSNKGEIKAVGSYVKKWRAGDIAYRTKDWGTEIEENGVKYFLMDEDALLATE